YPQLSPYLFIQPEDGIRARNVTGVQTCALPISQRIQRHVLQRHPVNENPARCGVVEAQQQTYGGCLASPAMSHQGHDLTRRNIRSEERRVGKQWRYKLVTRHHMSTL